MDTDRLRIHAPAAALDAADDHRAASPRDGGALALLTPGGPPYRLLWCRLTSGAPGDPPDERYYADEVRPRGADGEGHLEWEAVPGGLEQIVVHNVAELGRDTHALAPDTVVRVEERLDRGQPPQSVYLAFVAAAPAGARLARIVSYEDGAYAVQPVRRDGGAFVDDGPPIAGVPNVGELWDDEEGYLQGPPDFDRYVEILPTAGGWIILLHPPRMV